jgi:hypothetical protein
VCPDNITSPPLPQREYIPGGGGQVFSDPMPRNSFVCLLAEMESYGGISVSNESLGVRAGGPTPNFDRLDRCLAPGNCRALEPYLASSVGYTAMGPALYPKLSVISLILNFDILSHLELWVLVSLFPPHQRTIRVHFDSSHRSLLFARGHLINKVDTPLSKYSSMIMT